MIAHILTKNNEKTIEKTIESVSSFDSIIINDLGSSDKTRIIAKNHTFISSDHNNRSEARNKTTKNSGLNLMIEPWEVLVKRDTEFKSNYAYVSIIENDTIRKEIRYWKDDATFVNPAFEKIDTKDADFTDTILYSCGSNNIDELLKIVKQWKSNQPTAIAPHYCYASLMLMKGNWKEFMNASEHYMFLNKESSMSSVMNQYYYALACLVYEKDYKSTLQNINLCLCKEPLMAEFWCLMADVYYHLLNDLNQAASFYENAIFMGSRRPKYDLWPMKLDKYKDYPNKMIKSCKQLSYSLSATSSSSEDAIIFNPSDSLDT